MAKLTDNGRTLIASTLPVSKYSHLRVVSRAFGGEMLNDERVAEIAGTEVLAWDVVEVTTEADETQKLLVFTVSNSGLAEFSTYLVTEDKCIGGSALKTCLGGYRAAARIETWIGYDSENDRASGQILLYTAASRSTGVAALWVFERCGRITFNFDAAGQYEVAAFDVADRYVGGSSAVASSTEAAEAACRKMLDLVAGGLTAAGAALAGESVGVALASMLWDYGLFGAALAIIDAPAVGVAIAAIAFGAAFFAAAIFLADKLCEPEISEDGTRTLGLPTEGSSSECQVIYTYEAVPYDCGYEDSEWDGETGTMTVTWHTSICWVIVVTDAQVICH